MPELPEVETVRRSLQTVLSRRVTGIYLSRQAPVETTSPHVVRRALYKVRLTGLRRWGKYLVLETDAQHHLVLHLGMSGRLFFYAEAAPARAPHTHLEMSFADGSQLRFIDARRFGTISLCNSRRDDNQFLARLGPDYLDPLLDETTYRTRCRRHAKLSLKMLLLNQRVAAGMGNIYACEALYRAGLDPRRRVAALSDSELGRLLVAARDRLELGIRHAGTTFRDYLDGRGHRGKMQDFLQVYDRAGQWTLDGRGRVVRIVQQGRSTFFCPELQR